MWAWNTSLQDFEKEMNNFYNKIWNRPFRRFTTLQRDELNSTLSSTFRVFRMMTGVWFNVVLDGQVSSSEDIIDVSQFFEEQKEPEARARTTLDERRLISSLKSCVMDLWDRWGSEIHKDVFSTEAEGNSELLYSSNKRFIWLYWL